MFFLDRPIVVMGVSGCGKSSVAAALAKALTRPFIEGDHLHPAANIRKMSSGIPLDDSDRQEWLADIGRHLGESPSSIASCSALKRAYREMLVQYAGMPLTFLFLDAQRALIESRMAKRINHFMPAGLVASQFLALEDPADEPDVIAISADQLIGDIVNSFIVRSSIVATNDSART